MIQPKVHVLIEKEDKLLFLKRANTGCYDGYWCLPTGRVEDNEFPSQAAKREVLEEAGVEIDPVFVTTLYAQVPHFFSTDGPDYTDLCFFFRVENLRGEPVNREPKKHAELKWFPLNQLPDPLLPVARMGIDCYLSKTSYHESGWARPANRP